MTTSTPVNPAVIEADPLDTLDERRRSSRLGQFTVATLYPDHDADSVGTEVLLRDLSMQGVGLLAETPLAVGSTCRLRVGTARQASPSHAAVRITSCRVRSDGKFILGAEFC